MPGAAMTMWKSVAALMVMAVPVGCAGIPVAVQSLSRAELSDLVTDKTLYVPSVCDTPDGMLLYLAKDGTGWLDSRLMRGDVRRPSEMSIVFEWRVVDGSGSACRLHRGSVTCRASCRRFPNACRCFVRPVPPYNLLTTVTQGGNPARTGSICIGTTRFPDRLSMSISLRCAFFTVATSPGGRHPSQYKPMPTHVCKSSQERAHRVLRWVLPGIPQGSGSTQGKPIIVRSL